MNKTRLGLMGFGRIGRNVFRLLHERADLEIVAISDIADPAALTYLLKYDSIYGRFPEKLEYGDGLLTYGNNTISFTGDRNPADTSWGNHGVEIVLDTTSRFKTSDTLGGHLANGAKKVILTSSPDTADDIPLLLRGVNDEVLDEAPDIVALGSNTSNAAAPILMTLDESFGIKSAYMTVVKAMSNSGRLADVPTESFRTSRAAGENIIPAETNTAEILTQALPSLANKLNVVALNVPVVDGSTVDMVVQTEEPTDGASVNQAIENAVNERYSQIIEYTNDPIVSSDVRLNSHSGVYDSLATLVTGDDMVKTITWFNNGWGYSHRAVEVAVAISSKLSGGQS